jgi:hypothetical protein
MGHSLPRKLNTHKYRVGDRHKIPGYLGWWGSRGVDDMGFCVERRSKTDI